VHVTKRQRFEHDATVEINPRYTIELLYAPGYRSHFGWRRFQFNRVLANRFLQASSRLPRPDIVVCGIPTLELCGAAIAYGRRHQVPVLIDVRDLWPDAALNMVPRVLQPLGKLLLRRAMRANRRILSQATGILAISRGFMHWGLRHAGRPPGPHDGVYFMAYPRDADVNTLDRRRASEQWEARGVRGDGTFRCSFLAAIGSLYDMDVVLAAARRLRQAGDEKVQFVLCGDGPRVARLRKNAAQLPQVVVPGWVDSAEVQVLLENSHTGLIPYRAGAHTALPNKAVTFFAAGLPVVSTAGGELAGILATRDCGLTYRCESADDLLATLDVLRSEPNTRQRLGSNARKFFDDELDADKVYPRLVRHLESVVQRVARRAA
jgi:glycosyltransferase involved in cell wall biosynthesis